MEALLHVFSFNLREGFPHHKPIIIHGRLDSWSRHAEVGIEYRSAVTGYLGQFLYALATDALLPIATSDASIDQALAVTNHWLDIVVNAHIIRSDDYPTAWQIRSGLNYIDRRLFSHPEIAAAAASGGEDPANIASQLCSIVQLVAFAHALLRRCCFAVITATTDTAAQSVLNWRESEVLRRAAAP
jgi:hypothetical protein